MEASAANPSGATGPVRVLVHGFGDHALLYRHMMDLAASIAPQLTFAMILPTSHHLAIVETKLPPDRILCLEKVLSPTPKPPDLSAVANYAGNIHADVEAEKRMFKSRPATFQLARAVEIYQAYKAFVLGFRPNHVLLAHVESYEQKMLESLSHELRIPVSVPTDLRTLGGSFMSGDTQETLPPGRVATPDLLKRAEDFVKRFRERHQSALNFPIPEGERGAPLPIHKPPLQERAAGFLARYARHPDQFEWEHVRVSVLNNLPVARDAWWALRAKRAAGEFDLKDLGDLPQKFIYFPLHYTPESSINTPAPYFVDQTRAIDAIRLAMPSDYQLVVKEHPMAIMVRPTRFLRQLRRRSGLLVMNYKVSGRELIKRSSLTISVTGTSALEAFVLGRPALMLGGMFLTEYLGGVTPLSDLGPRIRKAIAEPPTEERIIRSLAEILSISRPFTTFHIHQPGHPAFTTRNVTNLIEALNEAIAARFRTWE